MVSWKSSRCRIFYRGRIAKSSNAVIQNGKIRFGGSSTLRWNRLALTPIHNSSLSATFLTMQTRTGTTCEYHTAGSSVTVMFWSQRGQLTLNPSCTNSATKSFRRSVKQGDYILTYRSSCLVFTFLLLLSSYRTCAACSIPKRNSNPGSISRYILLMSSGKD